MTQSGQRELTVNLKLETDKSNAQTIRDLRSQIEQNVAATQRQTAATQKAAQVQRQVASDQGRATQSTTSATRQVSQASRETAQNLRMQATAATQAVSAFGTLASGVTRLARGYVLLSASNQDSLKVAMQSIARFEALANAISGVGQVLRSTTTAWTAYTNLMQSTGQQGYGQGIGTMLQGATAFAGGLGGGLLQGGMRTLGGIGGLGRQAVNISGRAVNGGMGLLGGAMGAASYMGQSFIASGMNAFGANMALPGGPDGAMGYIRGGAEIGRNFIGGAARQGIGFMGSMASSAAATVGLSGAYAGARRMFTRDGIGRIGGRLIGQRVPQGAGWGSRFLGGAMRSPARFGANVGRFAAGPYGLMAAGIAGIGLVSSDIARGKYRVGAQDYNPSNLFGDGGFGSEQYRQRYAAEQRERYANVTDQGSFTHMMASGLNYFGSTARSQRRTSKKYDRMVARRAEQSQYAMASSQMTAGQIPYVGMQAGFGLTGSAQNVASTQAQLDQLRSAQSAMPSSSLGMTPEQTQQYEQQKLQYLNQEMQLIEANADARRGALVEELQLGQEKLNQLKQERGELVSGAQRYNMLEPGQQQEARRAKEKADQGQQLTKYESGLLAQVGDEEDRRYAQGQQVRIAEETGYSEINEEGTYANYQKVDAQVADQEVVVAKAEAEVKVDLADGFESKMEQINKETEAAVKKIVDQIINSFNQRNEEIEKQGAEALAKNTGRKPGATSIRNGFGP